MFGPAVGFTLFRRDTLDSTSYGHHSCFGYSRRPKRSVRTRLNPSSMRSLFEGELIWTHIHYDSGQPASRLHHSSLAGQRLLSFLVLFRLGEVVECCLNCKATRKLMTVCLKRTSDSGLIKLHNDLNVTFVCIDDVCGWSKKNIYGIINPYRNTLFNNPTVNVDLIYSVSENSVQRATFSNHVGAVHKEHLKAA